LALNSNLGVAHLAEAEIYRNEGRWSESQRAYERAAELSPSDPVVLLSYARLRGLLGESDQALTLTQRAVDLDPNNSHWLHRLGNELVFAGKLDAALTTLRDSTTMEPTDVVAFIWLGFAQIAYDDRDDAEETLQIAERLARANSDEGYYAIQLAELAYAHSHIERPRDAQRLFEEVMSLSDDYSLGTAALVLAHLAIGDADQALHHLHQAADTVTPDPEHNVWMLVKTNSLRDAILDRPQFAELRTQMTFYTDPSLAE
jgi:tetratricopeptide (TPR) repeat protein